MADGAPIQSVRPPASKARTFTEVAAVNTVVGYLIDANFSIPDHVLVASTGLISATVVTCFSFARDLAYAAGSRVMSKVAGCG